VNVAGGLLLKIALELRTNALRRRLRRQRLLLLLDLLVLVLELLELLELMLL
jgi:hypothetical protein